MIIPDALVKRLTRNCRYGSTYYRGGYRCTSRWSSWGRWVLVAVIAVGLLVLLLGCLCISRRRRSRGSKPVYGTGWMAGGKLGNNNNNNGTQMNNYNQAYPQQEYPQQGQGYNNNNPPPVYGAQQQQQPQYTGTTFNQNDGYYGQQQYGVQPPQNAYTRDIGAVDAPVGPPPGK